MKPPDTASKDAPGRNAGALAAPIGRDDIRTLIFITAGLAFFFYVLRPILLPFVVAGVIAYVSAPLLDWLAHRTRLPRALFAVLLFIVLIGAAALMVTLAGQHLVAEARATAADLQGSVEKLVRLMIGSQPLHMFGQTMNAEDIARAMLERIRDWFGQTDQIALIAGFSLAALMGTVLTAVLLCYFLVSGPSVARGLFWTVPPSLRDLVARIGSRVDPVLKRYFLGILTIVIYSMTAAYIGLGMVLGVEHAALLAVLTGSLETIPMIGSTSAAVIAGLVSLKTATGFMSIVAFTAYAVLLRLTIDQIVAPLVLGRAAHVHPVLIIFCFLAGAVILGIPGVILAVPVALIAKNALATLYGEEAG
jgi:predicted PurR-regulated permease PerM